MSFNIIKSNHCKLVRNFSLNVCKNQKKTHYDSLGITPKATQGDIKTAYYKLSKQHHPDLNKDNPSAADKFKDIAAAYEVLGNLKSRKLYDRGMVIRGKEEHYSEHNEPQQENFKHASFYHHRNQPASARQTSKQRQFDLDEWTRAHYSETFSSSFQKKQSGNTFVKDKVVFKEETQTIVYSIAVLIVALAIVMVYEANAAIKFDRTSTENKMKNEDPD